MNAYGLASVIVACFTVIWVATCVTIAYVATHRPERPGLWPLPADPEPGGLYYAPQEGVDDVS